MSGFLPLITAGFGIGQTIASGKAATDIAKLEEKQLKEQGIAEQAGAVQTAKEERRKSELLQSRVRALAAASGTALKSPDIQITLSDIDQRGEFNALAALHAGGTAARSKRLAAEAAGARGKQAKREAGFKIGATILSFAGGGFG